MIKKVIMKNLICSGCAGRIEKTLAKELDYVNSASFNFPNQVMLIDVTDDYDGDIEIDKIKEIVDSIEDGVETYSYNKRHLMETKKSVESYYSFFIGLGIYIAIYIVGFLMGDTYDEILVNNWYTPFFFIGYGFISYKIARKTYKGIKRKEIFNEILETVPQVGAGDSKGIRGAGPLAGDDTTGGGFVDSEGLGGGFGAGSVETGGLLNI